MYVIDTNIASELMRPAPTASVATWIATRDAEEMFLTVVSEAELHYAASILPAGVRKNEFVAALDRWLDVGFGGRVLPFDSAAARYYSAIASRRRAMGRPISTADCQIAAVTCSHRAALVTRNIRDFDEIDIDVINPWTAI